MSLFGMLFVVGIYNLGIFILSRRQKAHFWGFLLCLIFSLRVWIGGGYLAKVFPLEDSFYIRNLLNYGTAFSGAVTYLLFLDKFLPTQRRWLFNTFLGIGLGFLLILFTTPLEVYSRSISFYKFYLILVIGFYLAKFFHASKFKDSALRWVLWGNLILLLFVLAETINHTYFFASWEMTPWGFFGFVLANTLAISTKNREAQNEARQKRKIEENLNTAKIIHGKMFAHKIPETVGKPNLIFRPADKLGETGSTTITMKNQDCFLYLSAMSPATESHRLY